MRKVLLATTALATIGGVAAVATADVTISGAAEWRYNSVSDDYTSRTSDSYMAVANDVTISFSTTTDSGLTFGVTQNWGDGTGATATSTISGDFGTIEWTEGSNSMHAGSAYDVTSVGISGGHGDLSGYTLVNAAGTAITSVGTDEALITDAENGALNYHSPSFGGLTFGLGVSHLSTSDDNTSTSFGAKYSTEMMGATVTLGVATYDGVASESDGSHVGANIKYGDITFGIGSASNKSSATSKEEVVSYSVNYAMSSDITLNIGQANAENKGAAAASDDAELTNTTIGIKYSIAPGLYATLSSHTFEFKTGGSVNNDGQVTQAEIKMSF